MREQRWGRIVAISSAMVDAGSPGALHYVARKGRIIGFIRSPAHRTVRRDHQRHRGGPHPFPWQESGVHDELNLFETSIAVQAIKRTGQPEDLTGAPSYLVSYEAGFVTG